MVRLPFHPYLGYNSAELREEQRGEEELRMSLQFSLRRLLGLVTLVAVVCSLFASLWWPVAMLLLAGMNLIACVGFRIVKRSLLSGLAGVTSLLIVVAFGATFMGFYDLLPPPRSFWLPLLTAACISELATVVCWLFSGSPSGAAKN